MNYRNRSEDKIELKLKDRLVTVFLIFSVVFFILSFINTTKKIKVVNKEVKSREEQLAGLREEEGKLQKKLAEITSEEYFEKQVRNQLNLSKENEIILVLPDDETIRKLVPDDNNEDISVPVPNYKKWAEVFGISI